MTQACSLDGFLQFMNFQTFKDAPLPVYLQRFVTSPVLKDSNFTLSLIAILEFSVIALYYWTFQIHDVIFCG